MSIFQLRKLIKLSFKNYFFINYKKPQITKINLIKGNKEESQDNKNEISQYNKSDSNMNNNTCISIANSEYSEFNHYYNLHFDEEYPFTNIENYKHLLKHSKNLKTVNIDVMFIFDDLIKYQLDLLFSKEISFLIEILELLSINRSGTYKMYYLLEEKILKNIKIISIENLVMFSYFFSISSNGSAHFYNVISNEVILKKMSNLSEFHFHLLYNSLKIAKLDNNNFWVLAEKINLQYNKDNKV